MKPGKLGCSVNFKMTVRFLCRPPLFLDCLSIPCDYGQTFQINFDCTNKFCCWITKKVTVACINDMLIIEMASLNHNNQFILINQI